MQGCRWQEKSFNVAVHKDKPLDICLCGKEIFGVRYLYNGDTLCRECFSSKRSLSGRLGIQGLGFNTSKDKLWEFTDKKNFRQPVEVRSRGQWKRLLKKNGLIDDVECKKPNELKTPMDSYVSTGRKFIAQEITRELHQRGLYHKMFKRRR